MSNWLFNANTLKTNNVSMEKPIDTLNNEKASLNREHVGLLLDNPDTFATTLLTICLIMYGDETFKVDSLVLYQWLKEDFGVELCEENESKLAAIIIALTTNFFYIDLDVFKSICKTLTSGDPDLDEFDNPTIPEILWGLYEVSLVSDDTDVDLDKFSPSVELFINSTLKEDISDDSIEDEETIQAELIISENVEELKKQLVFIGIKNIPQFPIFEINS
jgi:hypothetical protein